MYGKESVLRPAVVSMSTSGPCDDVVHVVTQATKRD